MKQKVARRTVNDGVVRATVGAVKATFLVSSRPQPQPLCKIHLLDRHCWDEFVLRLWHFPCLCLKGCNEFKWRWRRFHRNENNATFSDPHAAIPMSASMREKTVLCYTGLVRTGYEKLDRRTVSYCAARFNGRFRLSAATCENPANRFSRSQYPVFRLF